MPYAKITPRNCDFCSKEYKPPTNSVKSRFCSVPCKNEAAKTRDLSLGRRLATVKNKCVACGTLFSPFKKDAKFCSQPCSHKGYKKTWRRGADHGHWRGGKHLSNGYVLVLDFEKEKNKGASSYSFEHRLVMENHIGRKLLPSETVHHKNGVRTDNRLENLELWSKSHPAGQRVEDKLKWAREIIQFYANFQST